MFNVAVRRSLSVALAFSMSALTGCGSGSATADADAATQVTVTCPDGTVIHGTLSDCPASTPTPPASPPQETSTIDGAAPIDDNFDRALGIEPTHYGTAANGNRGGIASLSDDPVGAFRFSCTPGQISYDDPIAFPGQPGKSHLHQFIGNTSADANSTYGSLRATGRSTCDNRGQPYALNRSSYWMPAMLNGSGFVVPPDQVLVYYKRLPKSDPRCGPPDATHVGICVNMPNGIKFIFGYDMAKMSGGPADTKSWDQWAMNFKCVADKATRTELPGVYHTLAEAAAACPVGNWLKADLDGPPCWDGKNLDTPDHRSHVVYATGAAIPGAGRACDAEHPYRIPGIAYQWFFTVTPDVKSWRLSSDDMMAKMGHPVVAGTTLHMDYFEAWSPAIKKEWHDHCIDEHRTCSNGDLGDGRQLKDAGEPIGGWIVQPLVPVPQPHG